MSTIRKLPSKLCYNMTEPASTSAQVYIQSPEYLSTVELCWDEPCFHHQKMLMKQFLVLRSGDARELLPGRFVLEDMSDWLISQRKLTPEKLWFAASEEGSDFTRLALWVNTNLMMRTIELQAAREFNLSPNQDMASGDLPDLTDKVKAQVVRGMRTISRTVAFHPCAELCCSTDVLVDLVPRLLLSLMHHRTPTHDRAFLALSDLAVTMVLEVLRKLPSTLKSPDTQVHYSRATGIHMVHSVQCRIDKDGSIEELNSALDSWSPSLIRSITEAVTAQVQKLFGNPQDPILPQAILSWLSESRTKAQNITVPPENPKELVLHLETIRKIIGLTVIDIHDGKTELPIELDNWPLIAEVENMLAQYNVKVSKRVEKVNWHLDPLEIPNMVTQIHNSLHSLFGTKLNMKMALSHRVHMMTRAITHHIVQQILTLRDTLCCKDTVVQYDDECDDVSCDSPDDSLEHVVILFLKKLLTATEETGDHLRPVCVAVAALVSSLVRSIADKQRKTSVLCQELEELKTSGGFGPVAHILYVDYRSRFCSSLGLEAFRDPNRSLLVANMLADKLLSHSTAHIELNQVGGTTAELRSAQKNKPKKSRITGFFRRLFRCCCCCISKQDVDD